MGSMKVDWKCVWLMFLASVCLSPAAFSQSTVSINGTVTDQTDAVIPNASITVTNNQTGAVRTALTNASGQYVMTQLPPGSYDLKAAEQGFTTVQRLHQEFLVGTTVTVDFALKVSSAQEVVEVEAVSPEIERTQSEVTGVLEPKQMDDLPIISRNFSEMAALTPGVQTTSQTSVGYSVGGAVTGVTIGNSTQYETGYTVDDVPIYKPSDGGLYAAMAQDWVQEFSVTTNQPPAEMPGAVSGYINAVTRSGTNQLHGRAYSLFQNSALNASSTNLVTPITSKAASSSQRVGGMVGGPIFKEKLFYFAGYEYYRSLGAAIFSGLPVAFQGSRGTLPSDNAAKNISNLNRQDLAELKLTYQISPKDSINLIGYYQLIGEPNIASSGFTIPENGNSTRNGDYQESVDWIHIFSNTTVNSFRFSSARDWDDEICGYATAVGPYKGPETAGPSFTAFGTTSFGSPTGYYASLSYSGNPGGSIVTGCNGRWGGDHFIGLYGGFYETVSITKGSHTIKFGGDAADPFYGSNLLHSTSDGSYSFPGTQTIPFSATNSATFPLSLSMTWTPFAPVNHSYTMVTGWSMGLFVEDTWRATKDLTINSGIRWDGDLSYSYFNTHNLAPYGQPVGDDFHTAAPRVGISATPFKDKSTVLRGGFGLYYGDVTSTEATGYISTRTNPSYGVIDSFTATSASSNPYCIQAGVCGAAQQNELRELMAWALVNNTIPDLKLSSVTVGGTTYALTPFTGAIPASGVANIDPNIRRAATWQATAGGSKDFHHGIVATADFAYNYGFDLDLTRNININPLSQTTGVISLLNPSFTTEYSWGSLGWFKNMQLLTKLRYNDHRGDLAQVSYTVSKAVSNSPGGSDFTVHSGGYSTNPFNFSVDDGPANTDQTHYLAINGDGKLPGGVEIAPIITFSSGLPITPSTTQLAGAAATTVHLTNGTTNVVTVPNCQAWYNSCYPTINGKYYGKGSLKGADTVMVNARVQRPIHLGESRVLLPMFEVYNIPNHVNVGTSYTTNALSTTFGSPSSSAITMRQIQIGVRFDF